MIDRRDMASTNYESTGKYAMTTWNALNMIHDHALINKLFIAIMLNYIIVLIFSFETEITLNST